MDPMAPEIVQVGAPVLRQKAPALSKKDIASPKTRALVSRMKKLLAKEQYGVGLAAPQVGVSVRLFIVSGRAFLPDEATEEEKKNPPPDMVFINPELVRASKSKREMAEGCLSVRGKYGTVLRSEKATVKALDEHGKPFTYHGSELVAHIFQHELDHLEGTLYVDKAVKLEDEKEKEELRKKYHPGKKEPTHVKKQQ